MVTLSTAGGGEQKQKYLKKAEILVYEWPFHLGILRFVGKKELLHPCKCLKVFTA